MSHLLRNFHFPSPQTSPINAIAFIAMAYSSRPHPLRQAVPPPPLRSPQQLPPPPPPPHHDTTLTLALALPPTPLVCPILSPRPPHARRQRSGGVASSSAFATVRWSSPTGEGDTPPCTECGKRFPSRQALFGHMRSHPERQWRGMTPPPHFRHGTAAGQFTEQEREVATSLLMLAGKRPGAGKGKMGILASSCAKESGSTSTSTPSPTAPGPARCDDHNKCSAVCARGQGFESGQALGGHKWCHCERACTDQPMVVATSSSCSASLATSSEAAATSLDINQLPPSGTPLAHKTKQGSSFNAMLDLKLGYWS